MHSQCCVTTTAVEFQNIFITPRGNPVPIQWSLPIPPALQRLATISLPLSLWLYLVYIFHVNGIIQRGTFCVWLLSLSVMFSRLIT